MSDVMRDCSALVEGKCSNGFPVKRACILIFGIPPCMDEDQSARLYPITGRPDPPTSDELLPIKSERDELRSQKAALESKLADCTKSHQKRNAELAALEDKLAEARRVLGIVAPYHDDCYCHEDDGLSGKCVHCVIIDAADALSAKPEAVSPQE